MRRRTALLVTCVLLGLAAPHASAVTARKVTVRAVKPPVVAVIDTGVRATHREFDYRGKASTTDQFVAWWDFTGEAKGGKTVLPAPGQTWDTQVADPYDKNGHGTLTASMVGGRTASSQKTPAAAPGTKLAIAKVGEGDGTISGNIAAAVTWADSTVHADVISISIGTIVPVPAALDSDVYAAIKAARAHGILVVVANGNGFANAEVPGDPGWANSSSSSNDVLAVGAAGADGYLVSTDPEVTAVFTVTGPSYKDNTSYVTESGTSFATPYVAGFAAALITASRQGNHPLSALALENLIKWSATDTATPPQFEGYGTIGAAELPRAVAHAKAGTMPTPNALNQLYVESVAGTLRTAWNAAS
ncbi:MAG: aprX2 [Frankiales bacterium]|nr:aprX2 [Frankiales bacterium]